MTFVDESAKKNCYALSWSFGEICCHCGCCSDDPVERVKARIHYHEEELKQDENFDQWFFDDPELLKMQKDNVVSNIKYHRGKIAEYKEELKHLEEKNVFD